VVCRGRELPQESQQCPSRRMPGHHAPPADDRVHDLLIIARALQVWPPPSMPPPKAWTCAWWRLRPGARPGTSSRIENYLGFPTGISGAALAGRAFSQAQKFGAQLERGLAPRSDSRCEGWPYSLDMADGRSMRSKAILIASGAQYRMPDIANLSLFLGRGIYYAATHLEAKLCADEDVIVVGRRNVAGQAAVFLAGSCRHVHMLVAPTG